MNRRSARTFKGDCVAGADEGEDVVENLGGEARVHETKGGCANVEKRVRTGRNGCA